MKQMNREIHFVAVCSGQPPASHDPPKTQVAVDTYLLPAVQLVVVAADKVYAAGLHYHYDPKMMPYPLDEAH
jgi:hypothetical protein